MLAANPHCKTRVVAPAGNERVNLAAARSVTAPMGATSFWKPAPIACPLVPTAPLLGLPALPRVVRVTTGAEDMQGSTHVGRRAEETEAGKRTDTKSREDPLAWSGQVCARTSRRHNCSGDHPNDWA